MYFVTENHDTVPATSVKENKCGGNLFSGTLISHNLLDSQNTKIRKFSNCKRILCPTMLMRLDQITIVGGDSDGDTKKCKLGLYELTEKELLWEPVPNSIYKMSVSPENLNHACCASYDNDGVALVSITGCRLMIHLFSLVKTAGKYWKKAGVPLPDLQNDSKYQIQSCVAIPNFLYCSLAQGTQQIILCKINLILVKQSIKYLMHQDTNDLPNDMWEIKNLDSNLKYCCLSALNEKVFCITSGDLDGKTHLEVKQFELSASKPAFQYRFSSSVKIVTASIVSGIQNTLVVVHHDDKLQKCFVTKINLVPYHQL